MANIGNGRILRVCDLCGGVDDHPRHSIVGTIPKSLTTGENLGAPDGQFPMPTDEILDKVVAAAPSADRARLVRDLMDTTTSDRHLDCCAAAGCPNGTCGPQVAGVPGIGKKMLDHVMKLQGAPVDRPDVVRADG